MIYAMIAYIQQLPQGTVFTYRDVCLGCFGRSINGYATLLMVNAYRRLGYIVIGATEDDRIEYKKV